MHRLYGLRPRLLAALLVTSAVTLVVAAVALFRPLQERPREESVGTLEAPGLAARPGGERALREGFHEARYARSRRTDSRGPVYDLVPRERYGSEPGDAPPPRDVYTVLLEARTVRTVTADAVVVSVPLSRRGRPAGILQSRKPL